MSDTPRRYRTLPAEEFTPARRVLVATHHDVEGFWSGYTDACSGCSDVGEYGTVYSSGGFDANLGREIGSGCDECGYTGKRRWRFFTPFDRAAWDTVLDELSGRALPGGGEPTP